MAEVIKLDVLAIAAHPDDVEITCGGTLIKMAKMGRKVGVLDLTRGELGTKGDEDDRAREAAAAADIMGLAWRQNAAIEDGNIQNNKENRYKIAHAIRSTRPELVLLPHWEQRHPDHRITMQLGFDACFHAGLKKIELEGEPHRPRKIAYVSYFRNHDHSFLVDISDCFKEKVLAVAAYQSQFGTNDRIKEAIRKSLNVYDLIKSGGKDIFAPGINIYDLLYTRAHQFGQLVGVEFAEAFTLKEQILIDDPQAMPVRSI